MTAARFLQLVSGGMWGVSWVLPATETSGELFAGTLRGWQAFLLAISPALGRDLDSGVLLPAWMAASALTNLVVLSAIRAAIRRDSRTSRRVGWALVVASGLNVIWLLLPDVRPALRVGYFLWAGSYTVGACGFFADASRHRSAAELPM